jgi:hypothetical protein
MEQVWANHSPYKLQCGLTITTDLTTNPQLIDPGVK